MLINSQGKAGTFKETDIRVEQLNKSIKSHARGVNASPGLLEKITPAIGYVQELTEKMFDDLGVHEDQHHAHVRQHQDVILLLEHLSKSNIFDFSQDKSSNHTVIDLYRTGLHRLAGLDGGHAKHLRRHLLRSRTRHTNEMPPNSPKDKDAVMQENDASADELVQLDREFALDSERPKLTLLEQLDMIQWDLYDSDDNSDPYI